jgi:stress response protein YsnF
VALVPFTGAKTQGNVMRVAYTMDRIQEAPTVDDAESLSHDDEAGLYRHYGLEHLTRHPKALGDLDGDSGHDLSGPTTDHAMTRSEEELVVGTATVETGRARLRKWVETEPVTRAAVVSHEEVRVEREPITDANRDRALRGPEISEEEHELVPHEQRPAVQEAVVAKERFGWQKRP